MYKEYIDIKFGDKWASEFNLVVVSVGDRYTPPAYGNINSNTSTVAGKRGVYKWKTQYSEKIFTVEMAFDNLSVRDVSKIKTWLNPSKVQKLIFNDEPYKFYYACLNADPKFEYLPFIEGESRVGSKTVQKGVLKGELVLEFCAIDGVGYSEADSYETVEIEAGLEYKDSEYVNTIMPWVQTSNLLNDDDYTTAAKIYTASFFNQEIEDTSKCGLGADLGHRFYLLNSGDTEAKLNLSFDFVMVGDESLVIYVEKVRKVNKTTQNDGWERLGIVSVIIIDSFKDYIPFIEYIGQENYDILIQESTTEEIIEAKKEIMSKYIIEIDSELREIYIKEKEKMYNVLNISKFNGKRDFLKLCESNFVDYQKPFPTIILENGVINPDGIIYSGTAIEDTYFNEVYLGATTIPYRLANVHFNWKHTYN